MERCAPTPVAVLPAAMTGAAQPGTPPRVLVSLFAFNEGEKFANTLARFPAARSYDVLIVDDGSSDGSTDDISDAFVLLRNDRNIGLGASIKRAFRYALEHDYEILVIMAGNGKDDPGEIPRLLEPILEHGYDFVQGSRFLPGGGFSNMPFYRVVATRFVHPLVFSLFVRRLVTETTNGFRAFRTQILRDSRIDWEQDWLDMYELEQYVHFKVCRLGYARKEVPVSKAYPPKGQPYTKVKAITGWWSMVKPVVFLGLGLRR
jgi:dolichol-phosphate mannosyltransferase